MDSDRVGVQQPNEGSGRPGFVIARLVPAVVGLCLTGARSGNRPVQFKKPASEYVAWRKNTLSSRANPISRPGLVKLLTPPKIEKFSLN